MGKEKPNYYAIIPAEIRYDKKLTPNSKLLYGEITALANKEGYCWAGNTYFSDLYDVEKVTVSRWIRELKEMGYIDTELIYQGKTVTQRKITLLTKLLTPTNKNVNTPINKIVKENNTSNNNTLNIYRGIENGMLQIDNVHTLILGEFENVKLSNIELEKLNENYGETKTNEMIEKVSAYVKQTGKKYKSHYATILTWIRKDNEKQPKQEVKIRGSSLGDISDMYD